MVRLLSWIVVAAGSMWLASGVAAQARTPHKARPRAAADVRLDVGVVVAVAGPSNLHRLGLNVTDSPMGSDGLWGHVPSIEPSGPRTVVNPPAGDVVLTGADLYRLDCQACHKQDGTGAPGQVKSMLDPVRSMSPVEMIHRMQERGRAIDPTFAKDLAASTRKDILERLQHGGDKMPAFDHLQGVEVDALLAYLNALAGMPEAQPSHRIEESTLRVGEHLVKGTCHTCHDATGPYPGPQALMNGAVPSLASIIQRRSVGEVINKVRHGAPITMGDLGLAYRGRMPVFSYLTPDEVADAYDYLQRYPPQNRAPEPPAAPAATSGRSR